MFDTVMAPARAEYGLTVTDIFRHADDSNMVLLVLDVADMEQAKELDALVDPDTRGDPDSPCAGTCKSTAQLARALTAQGHRSLTTPSGVAEAAWKAELARFAAETGLAVTVCHFPPGTSKTLV